jgi:hypothetical protein
MKKIGIVIAFLVLSVTTGATASETNAEVPSEVLSEVQPRECVSDGIIVEILDKTNNRITLQLVDGTA